MKDIEYFSESRMRDDGLRSFANKLPSNLKDAFNNVTGSGAGDLELQTYKGPSYLRTSSSSKSETLNPVYGVQEIMFWHATPELLAILPVIFGISRGKF